MKRKNTEKYISAPLLIPTICFILGIFIAKTQITLFAQIAIYAIAVSTYFAIKNTAVKNIIICILIVLFAFQYTNFYNRKQANHISKLLDGKPIIRQKFKALVVSKPVRKNNHYSFTAQLLQVKDLPIKGRVNCYTFSDDLAYGQTFEALLSIDKFKQTNPNETIWSTIYENNRISANASISDIISISPDIQNLSLTQKLFLKVQIIKEKLYESIDAKFPLYSALIKAALTGNTSFLSEEDENNTAVSHAHFRHAGVLHLLAVSGLHTGLIFFAVFTLLSLININFARIASLFFLLFFAALCDFSPSVMRASLMISILMISTVVQRKQNFWQIISLTVLIILIFNPNTIFNVSFLLSFTAVLALNIVGKLTYDLLSKQRLRKVLFIVLSSFLITLFIAPFTLYYFNNINLNALISNIVLIPLFSLILLSSLITLAMPESFFFFKYYRLSLDFLVYIFGKSLAFFKKFDYIYYLSINKAQLIVLLSLLATTILLFNIRKKSRKYLIPLFFILIPLFIFLSPNSNQFSKVIFFDTGTSDSFLISTKGNENILIDCADARGNKAEIENNVIPYFHKNGIRTLDYLILTHPHSDHVAGLPSLAKQIKIKNLIVSEKVIDNPYYQELLAKSQDRIENIISIQDTCTIYLQSSSLKFLHPNSNYQISDMNNLSLVARWSEDDMDFLFTGDIEAKAEAWILSNYPEELEVELLKVPHHGSKTSSSKSFLGEVSPKAAIISAGKKNRYNFPNAQTIESLEEQNSLVFQTGIDGAVICVVYPDYAEIYGFNEPHKKYYIVPH